MSNTETAERAEVLNITPNPVTEGAAHPTSSTSLKRLPLYEKYHHGYCQRTVSLSELLAFLCTLSTVAKLLTSPSVCLERNP